ncbi:hypothetical protein JXB41_03710 [Candidatus Woesearchaeota archaeon]|nr:hypothetical protein [Candidatus Woesearchaeota archaeon]
MWPFKEKFKRIEDEEQKDVVENAAQEETSQDAPAGVSTSKLSADLTKLKAQFDQFVELRNVFNERFTRLNEQVGELRGMIMDSNRAMQDIEVKTVKAVDLVGAVQPDKLMVEVRKQDAKVEALKANLESNEAMMKSILEQLKEMRQNINKFRGIEQIVKLSEDVKKELMDVKKMGATVERHSDKVEGIFIESQKKFQEFEKLSDKFVDIDKRLSTVTQQSDQTKVKIPTLAAKKEVENLISKFNDFEKHVGNVIDLLTKRANELPKDVNDRFKKLEKSINDAFNKQLKKAEKTNKILSILEQKAPKIAAELKIGEVVEKQQPQQTQEQQKEGEKTAEQPKEGQGQEKKQEQQPQQAQPVITSGESEIKEIKTEQKPKDAAQEGEKSGEAGEGAGEETKEGEASKEDGEKKPGLFGKFFGKKKETGEEQKPEENKQGEGQK